MAVPGERSLPPALFQFVCPHLSVCVLLSVLPILSFFPIYLSNMSVMYYVRLFYMSVCWSYLSCLLFPSICPILTYMLILSVQSFFSTCLSVRPICLSALCVSLTDISFGPIHLSCRQVCNVLICLSYLVSLYTMYIQ